jgi:hypothetical protein
MNRLALAAATATAPTYAAEIPALIHQRLKDGAARNKATLTFAEKRVLVLGIGRRHASRKAEGPRTMDRRTSSHRSDAMLRVLKRILGEDQAEMAAK